MRFTLISALILTTVSSLGCGARSVGGPAARQARTPVQIREMQGVGITTAAASEDYTPPPSIQEHLDSIAGELPEAAVQRAPHPLADKTSAQLEAILRGEDQKQGAVFLGPASLGKTNRGALFGGVQMQPGPAWHIVNPRETWGTQETIDYIAHAINRVYESFPNSPSLNIGDISKASGGHLSPHVSHQSGRDVDLGFYYVDGSAWYSKANARNFDVPRNWALLKYTITQTDVEAIFLDRSVQAILRAYATSLGEDPQWLDQVFGGPTSKLRPLVLHEPGHKTHFHIRYYNPIAQETGRRIYRILLKLKKIKPPTYYKKYKVRRGDSLNRIAQKFKTSVAALRKANRLRNNRIYAGRTYKIPKKGGVVQPAKLVLPARRIPTIDVDLAPTQAADTAEPTTGKSATVVSSPEPGGRSRPAPAPARSIP